MKTYNKILGIASTMMVLALLGLVVYGIVEDEGKNVGVFLLLLIPIYILLNFIIINRFGFSPKMNIGSYSSVVFLIISCVCSLLIVLIGYFSFQKFDAFIRLTSSLETTRDMGLDSTAYGYYGTLKVKYIDSDLYYSLRLRSKHKFEMKKVTFTIRFLDKDEFIIAETRIFPNTRTITNNRVIGIETNRKLAFDLKDYLRIAKWDLVISHNHGL